MAKLKKKNKKSFEEKTVRSKNDDVSRDSDDDLIDFLIENDDQLNRKINFTESLAVADEKTQKSNDESSDETEDEENRYNGRVLNRKEYFEHIYTKYARELYSSDKDKVAKSLRKKIKVRLGEGKDKKYVFVNEEPVEIERKMELDNKETIALQLTKTRLGFSYFCSYHDDRFNRICFQPFKDKREVVDHYYSLHLNKLKNYYCNDENCRKSYVFHKQMKGHLIRSHNICSNFDKHFTPISYYFKSRCQVTHITDKDSMKLYQNRIIPKP